jgi:hypothetical protein
MLCVLRLVPSACVGQSSLAQLGSVGFADGCQLGTFPTMDASRTLDMAPVDYVAKAIVAVTFNSAAPIDNFNVCQPVLFSYAELFRALVAFGYAVTEEPYAAFYARLKQVASDTGAPPHPPLRARRPQQRAIRSPVRRRYAVRGRILCVAAAEENALSPLLGHLSPAWATAPPNPKYDQANVVAALAHTPIRCPRISEVQPSRR